jgi:copper homeostasis protein (lipoprotein)
MQPCADACSPPFVLPPQARISMATASRFIESKLNYQLKRQAKFEPIEPALRMRGMYSYMADSGWFTECVTSKRLPVAQEADNAALEAAYSTARPAPGAALLARLDGRIASRMPMEGPGPILSLIVDSFRSISAEQGCSAPLLTASLENTYWKLMRLGNEAVAVGERQREPHLILQILERRAVGCGGCNRFVGSYSVEADRVTFGQLASARMACVRGMEQEQAFFDALAKAAKWRIVGARLELFDAAGDSLAQFESRYLK